MAIATAVFTAAADGQDSVTIYTPYAVRTLAGYAQTGFYDGVGATAQFQRPSRLALDTQGNLHVVDTDNHAIRRVSPKGAVDTLAGVGGESGSDDGPRHEAKFNSPTDVAVGPDGTVYVADSGNHVIRRISSTGTVSTFAGRSGAAGVQDGTGDGARFSSPASLALEPHGSILVADSGNLALRRIVGDRLVTTVGRFYSPPTAVAVDRRGNILLGLSGFARFDLIRLSSDGATESLLTLHGPNRFARYRCSLAVTDSGDVLVADNVGGRLLAVTSTGSLQTLFTFAAPAGVAVGDSGTLFVSEGEKDTIWRLEVGAAREAIAGTDTSGGFRATDGIRRSARFASPSGLVRDEAGNIFVADNSGPSIRKFSATGQVTTIAGRSGYVGGDVDGIGEAARFQGPFGIALDQSGNLIVTDRENFSIRKVSRTGVVTTLAGLSGFSGDADGVGSEARFGLPCGITIGPSGDAYVCDFKNHTIRRITPAGVVTTFAGSANQAGAANGGRTDARFNRPIGICSDANGNLFVADTYNHCVRRIGVDGLVTTIAGMPGRPGKVDGTRGNARFIYPTAIAVDRSGTVFVGDGQIHTLRRIALDGMVTTLAGHPDTLFAKDGIGREARLSAGGITTDDEGNVYFTDSFNNELRVASSQVPTVAVQSRELSHRYGESSVLTASVRGAVEYEWLLDGNPIPGATTSSYAAQYPGRYFVRAMNAAGEATALVATVAMASRIANLAARTSVLSDVELSIVGFSLSGPPGAKKQVLIRAAGPTLGEFGVANAAQRPVLTLFDAAGSLVASNSQWTTNPVIGPSNVSHAISSASAGLMAAAGGFPFSTADDCAMVAELPPGIYTAQVANVAAGEATALAEIYEIRGDDSVLLSNLATRAMIRGEGDVAVAGFVISGSAPARVLIRSVGPGLRSLGINMPVARPTLSLFDEGRNRIACNAGWDTAGVEGTSAVIATSELMMAAGAFPLSHGSADCAFVATLPPGNYYAHVESADGGGGVVLVEVYAVP